MSSFSTPVRQVVDAVLGMDGTDSTWGTVASAGADMFKNHMMAAAANAMSRATGMSMDAAAEALNTLSSAGQQAAQAAGRKRARNESGQSRSEMERSNITLPHAFFMPGRGAELSQLTKGYQGFSKLNLPPGNAKIHNAFAEMSKQWSPVECGAAFAYKGILNSTVVAGSPAPTRFYTHQFIRHYGNYVNGPSYASNTTNWNNTLGPDSSLVRKIPANNGSAYGAADVSGFSGNLISPYRYPQQGDWQAMRLTRVVLENIGWVANPLKFITDRAATASASLASTYPYVYNDPLYQVGYSAAYAVNSHPNLQPRNMAVNDNAKDTACYYRCQQGVGSVAYQFANDGTTAVVVDIVVHKLKKGQTQTSFSTATTALENQYKQGYLNSQLANRGALDLSGAAPSDVDIFVDSKVEFMPKQCLKYTPSTADRSPRPFVQVTRDQFIVAAGSVKPYKFNLPALNYDARNYNSTAVVDDLTYIVSVAFSTAPVPIIESGTSAYAVVDRRGNSLNMSVTGNYNEKPHPVYLSDFNPQWYLNGVLNAPYYQTAVPTLYRSEIISPDTASRGPLDSTSYIQVGPSNTTPGA